MSRVTASLSTSSDMHSSALGAQHSAFGAQVSALTQHSAFLARRSMRHPLYELTYFVGDHGRGDLPAVGRAFRQRLREVQRLLRRDLWWHRRLQRIDNCFDDHQTL